MKFVFCLLLGLTFVALGTARADRVLPPEFTDELRGNGMTQPVNFDFLPDGRVIAVEHKTGCIRLVRGVGNPADTVGVVPNVRAQSSDEGLLGVAVDARWPIKPYVYVLYSTTLSYNLKLTRFTLTGDVAGDGDGRLALDLASQRDLLPDLPDDTPFHDGGTVMFGPDDKLYVALGDDEVDCSAQDIHQLRGKILRLRIEEVPDGGGPAVNPMTLDPFTNPFHSDPDARTRLVWQYGLRNPFSFDFDFNLGSKIMAIADVGEVRWEELDVTPYSGRNFGWPFFEGNETYDFSCANPEFSTLTPPSLVMGRNGGPASIMTGGISWHPTFNTTGFPQEYWGQVFYYDFFAGRVGRLVCDAEGQCAPAPPVPGQPDSIAWGTGFQMTTRMRFGPDGMLWYLQGAELRRITHPGTIGLPGPLGGAGTLALRAYPLPSQGALTFESSDPAGGRIGIYDLAGRCVRTLDVPAAGSGVARVAWDRHDDAGRTLPGGVFFARLTTATQHATRRLVLL